MSTALRLVLLLALAVVVLRVLLKPQQFRRLKGRVLVVGWAFVAAILISAALRVFIGFG